MRNVLQLLFLLTPLFGFAAEPPDASTVFSSKNCSQVEAKRQELIDWNHRIQKAGVAIVGQYPQVKKTSKGCEIDVQKFLPRDLIEKNLSYFGADSNINCHGSTQYISGLSDTLEGELSFLTAVQNSDLCTEIKDSKELKAGDVGLIQGSNAWKNPMMENDMSDFHSFTYLSHDLVLQSPGIRRGQYPKIFSQTQLAIDWFHDDGRGKSPVELRPECRMARNQHHTDCKTFIRYFRCDFSRPSCTEPSSRIQSFEESIDGIAAWNKPDCSRCQKKRATATCTATTRRILEKSQSIRRLTEKVRLAANDTDQIYQTAMNPPPPEVLAVLEEIKNAASLSDPEEKKVLAMAMMDLNKYASTVKHTTDEITRKSEKTPGAWARGDRSLDLEVNLGFREDMSPKKSVQFMNCYSYWLSKNYYSSFMTRSCQAIFDLIEKGEKKN
jgi:hypothetical protein